MFGALRVLGSVGLRVCRVYSGLGSLGYIRVYRPTRGYVRVYQRNAWRRKWKIHGRWVKSLFRG